MLMAICICMEINNNYECIVYFYLRCTVTGDIGEKLKESVKHFCNICIPDYL